MPHQRSPAWNRITQFGKIEASPLRGTFTGNRGIRHSGRQIVRWPGRDSWVIRAGGRW